jgi:hypothetical protein
MYHSSQQLQRLVRLAETDAWLSLGLMFHLSVLPLTRQLTCLSGNLWGKTLQVGLLLLLLFYLSLLTFFFVTDVRAFTEAPAVFEAGLCTFSMVPLTRQLTCHLWGKTLQVSVVVFFSAFIRPLVLSMLSQRRSRVRVPFPCAVLAS